VIKLDEGVTWDAVIVVGVEAVSFTCGTLAEVIWDVADTEVEFKDELLETVAVEIELELVVLIETLAEFEDVRDGDIVMETVAMTLDWLSSNETLDEGGDGTGVENDDDGCTATELVDNDDEIGVMTTVLRDVSMATEVSLTTPSVSLATEDEVTLRWIDDTLGDGWTLAVIVTCADVSIATEVPLTTLDVSLAIEVAEVATLGWLTDMLGDGITCEDKLTCLDVSMITELSPVTEIELDIFGIISVDDITGVLSLIVWVMTYVM